MKILRTFLLALLVIVVIVAAGGFALYWDTTRGPLPQTRGALEVIGLEAQVEILRDQWGVPHIYAFTPADLYFAQGYTIAQDRWWQMEFFRRIAKGELGELVGMTNATFGNDVFIRTAGWRRSSERDVQELSPDALAMVTAFANGVNAYIRDRAPDDLALEYRLLGLTGNTIPVEPWTVLDTVAWGKVIAWQLSTDYDNEIANQTMFAALGETMTRDYLQPYPYDLESAPTIVKPEDIPLTESSLTNPVAAAPLTDRVFSPIVAGGMAPDDYLGGAVRMTTAPGTGSNNWTVTGTLSASGLPLLANDMHLDPLLPGNWYTVGLHCLPVREECPYDMVGYTFPPVPGIVVGHNADIAWAMTNVGTDAQDLYILDWNPDNPLQYRWDGAWREVEVIEEVITFADGTAPVTIQVRQTHLGPVINDNQVENGAITVGFNTTDPLVLRWTGYEPSSAADALMRFARAEDWEDFREGARLFTFAAQNLVFADVRGNIGYQMPGLTPIRPAGRDGLTPQPASSDADVWQGFIPFDSLPRILNPAREHIASANQAVVPLAFYDTLDIEGSTLISYDFANGERASTIETRLSELAPHTPDTFRAIQTDNFDLNAARILPYLAPLPFNDPNIDQARNFLTDWDGQMNADSGQALLYGYFSRALVVAVFGDQLPDGFDANSRDVFRAWRLIDDPENIWWDDANTADRVETRDDMLARAMRDAVVQITADYGPNPVEWRWGDAHVQRFVSNPLGASGIDLIENMVNRTVTGYGGTTTAINATEWEPMRGTFEITQHPSERLIIDLSDFDASLSVLPAGQSGHPFSPHYDDMAPIYRNEEYTPLLFTRPAVELATRDRLVLSPPGVE